MFNEWLRKRRERNESARALYSSAMNQSRLPCFYERLGVADSAVSRHETLCLHLFLLSRRLSSLDEAGRKLAQALFDLHLFELDRSLREMGVGDLAVPKRKKKMAAGFYVQIERYAQALDEGNQEALESAIGERLHDGENHAEAARILARYLLRADSALSSWSPESAPNPPWPPPEAPAPETPAPGAD